MGLKLSLLEGFLTKNPIYLLDQSLFILIYWTKICLVSLCLSRNCISSELLNLEAWYFLLYFYIKFFIFFTVYEELMLFPVLKNLYFLYFLGQSAKRLVIFVDIFQKLSFHFIDFLISCVYALDFIDSHSYLYYFITFAILVLFIFYVCFLMPKLRFLL